MKRVVLLLTAICFCISANAQLKSVPSNGWKLKKYGLILNSTQEMPHEMGISTFFGMRGQKVPSSISNYQFNDGEVVSMQCDNGELRFDVALQPPGMEDTELHIALVHIAGRVDEMRFEAENPEMNASYIDLRSESEEVALELIFTKKSSLNKWIHVHAGIGSNTGLSYNNQVCINSHVLSQGRPTSIPRDADGSPIAFTESEYTDMVSCGRVNNGISQRVFLQGGFGFTFFKRVELGIDYRRGMGIRSNFGGPIYGVTQKSLGISLRYVLK